MRLAVNRWTIPAEWDVARTLAATKAAGFDGIELNLEREGPVSLASSERDLAALASAVSDAGLEIPSLSSNLYGKSRPTDNNPAVRQEALEIARRHCDAAVAMGVREILVVPGRVTPEVSYDTAYARAQEFVSAAAEYAQQAGVRIGVENVWNKFLLSPLEMARFVDEIDSPAVGVYFDVGNVLIFGFPQHWIRILKHRIFRLHVKDFQLDVGNRYGFRNLLEGDVPWTEVTVALREIGYDDWATAEVDGYPAAPDLGLAHICQSMRHIFRR